MKGLAKPSSMSLTVEKFAAHAEDRLYAAPLSRPRDARRRAVALGVVASLYLALTTAIFIEVRYAKPNPPAEEIPVEIVVEPPPPPPQEKPPDPKPPEASPQTPLDEKPAYDAPREGTADKDNGDLEKDAKAAPPAPAPTPEPTPDKAPGAEAQDKAPTPLASATPEPQPTLTPADAPPAPVANGDTPPPAPARVANLEPPAPAEPAPPAAKPAPIFASVPDIDFGGAAMKTPVSGGQARATYLSMVYGKIMPLIRKPKDAKAIIGRGHGSVAFSIDGQGRLVDRYVAEESGSRELDRSVFNAIGAASPFPPPPNGATQHLVFTYNGS